MTFEDIEKVKKYQILYNICWTRINALIAKEIEKQYNPEN